MNEVIFRRRRQRQQPDRHSGRRGGRSDFDRWQPEQRKGSDSVGRQGRIDGGGRAEQRPGNDPVDWRFDGQGDWRVEQRHRRHRSGRRGRETDLDGPVHRYGSGRIANPDSGDTRVNNNGVIAGNGNLPVTSTALQNGAGGTIASGQNIELQVTQQLDN